MSNTKLSELAERTIDDITMNPVANSCSISLDEVKDIRDRATELEQMVQYLAHECAKVYFGTMDEWIKLAQDCIGSAYWRDTLAAIEKAREEADNAHKAQGD